MLCGSKAETLKDGYIWVTHSALQEAPTLRENDRSGNELYALCQAGVMAFSCARPCVRSLREGACVAKEIGASKLDNSSWV